MVVSKLFRQIARRSLWVAALSVTSGPMIATNAWGQTGIIPPAVGGAVPEFSLGDIPLAEGEQIINTTIDGKSIDFGGQNYRMVDPANVPTLGEYQSPYVEPAPLASAFPGTGSCANGSCGHCGRCSRGGHGAGVQSATHLGGRPRMGAGGNACGPTCDPYRYVAVDALYMMNNGAENNGFPALFNMDDFEFEMGPRVTVGFVPDCREGYEFSFVGPFNWETGSRRSNPAGGLGSNMVAGLPVPASDLTSFFDATFQEQRLEAEYFSFEANRTKIGWDVIKLLHGIRYIEYSEDYFYYSDPLAAGVNPGLLRSSTENRLIGAQVGIDLTYPMTCRLWSDARARAGAYANFAENTFQLINDGNLRVFNEDDEIGLAGVFEIGGGFRYYLTNNLHIRAGSELWYITQLATAQGQFRRVVRPTTGRNTDSGDDVFMAGFTLGGEWKF
jgi:hypothetical protein